MELLLSNFLPAKISKTSFRDVFSIEISKCAILRIASGYITADSLVDLKKFIELNRRPKIELMIGMHYFEGFTQSQYDAAISLNNFLNENNLGCVSISRAVKFHGKMYSFNNENGAYSSVVGSSNLGSLFDNLNKTYEANILVHGAEAQLIDDKIIELSKKLAVNIDEINNIKIVESPSNLLDDNEGVEHIKQSELENFIKSLSNITFNIPLKSKPKSNLNAFFGKGRLVKKKRYILPRHWYEVEIIVSKKITSSDNYPKDGRFWVITDDGYKFECKASGTNHKNLRSYDDLKILGKFIKGRLENSGLLKTGELVTNDILAKYGKDHITLTKSSVNNTWFLEYKQKFKYAP